MQRFASHKEHMNNRFHYSFTGFFDEFAKLPTLEPSPFEIEICLRNITGLNSLGTKLWCQWVREIPPNSKVKLTNCPVSFIKCFNQVNGSLSQNVRVESFYVPYFSEKTGERTDSLFSRGVQFKNRQVDLSAIVLDTQMNEMELDVFPDFFDFIKAEAA